MLQTPICGGSCRTFLYCQLDSESSGSLLHIAHTSPRSTVPPGHSHGIQGWPGKDVLNTQPVGTFQPTQSLVPNTHSVGRAGSVSSTYALAKDLYLLPGMTATSPPVITRSLEPCPSSDCFRIRKSEPREVHAGTPGVPLVDPGLHTSPSLQIVTAEPAIFSTMRRSPYHKKGVVSAVLMS